MANLSCARASTQPMKKSYCQDPSRSREGRDLCPILKTIFPILPQLWRAALNFYHHQLVSVSFLLVACPCDDS
jgi:hypothetical protein